MAAFPVVQSTGKTEHGTQAPSNYSSRIADFMPSHRKVMADGPHVVSHVIAS